MRVGLGLGSNQGDRLELLRQARQRIVALPDVAGTDCLCAPVFETDPVGCPPGSGAFFNTVMEINAADSLSPHALLAELRNIEAMLGRPSRYPRNAPRPLDIDILYAGELALGTGRLTLPHPRLACRRFVLTPLNAIRPTLILPGFDKAVAELLRELDDPAKVTMVAERW